VRSFVPFGGLWAMPIEVPYSLLVRDGDLAWSCGQVPLDGAARVLAPGDLARQTEIVCDTVEEVLRRGGLAREDLGKLLLYYVAREDGDRERMTALCRARFGARPLLVPIAVPHFYYDGLRLEVDAFAGARRGQVVEKSNAAGSVHILDGGELAWAAVNLVPGRLAEGEDLLGAALRELDLHKDGRISEHWIAPPGATAQTLRETDLISDEGALVAGACDRDEVIGELTFAKGNGEAARTWSKEVSDVRVAGRQRGRLTWVSARCLDGGLDLVEQTTHLMAAIERMLRELGVTFQDVVKSTSHYVGGSTPEELHDNMGVRNHYYRKPGPASTGLPVFALADPNSRIAVDVLAARRG
jgi:enamine deaminase RidA (YjgF/YER057c/UK114 family)